VLYGKEFLKRDPDSQDEKLVKLKTSRQWLAVEFAETNRGLIVADTWS
jgi:hypothetical protein|tara:strand:- start:266 stop:409 length:144 start_codon:yes stop_codon:yes gene_type:complete